ncbi:hypothetical protein [Aromatoleum evansii]|uniref:hypothetical protein n=1 Tax=Aromatoleum evansii TaxID=59406 RepID=UPI00145CE64B|nr:hypothetical protein [Aromatoleum evansii]NMG30068.1 hypothetical protein [Aromatoleum evansii]
MRLISLTLLLTAGVTLSARAAEFIGVRIDEEGGKLTLIERGGSTLLAPRFGDQDGFDKPGISENHRYAGWLALFPNRGASYSQPIELVVMDTSKHTRRFSGNFGMVFGWCFAENSDAVIYRYQFPHGATPIGFDMRRLKDGKLLRRALVEPVNSDEDESEVIRTKAPVWTRCAQESATGG